MFNLKLAAAMILGLCMAASSVLAKGSIDNFAEAKRVAASIYKQHSRSFYCDCPFSYQGNKLIPQTQSCGYQIRKQAVRGNRIEWEHVMPAWDFGHQRQCWQQGGRKACQKDPVFNQMEADLHNLVPSIGELNADRSNFGFGLIAGEPRAYGQCDFEVDFEADLAEPRPEIRGDIARIYLYMALEYQLNLSSAQRKLFEVWNRQDPVDDWERQRDRLIQQKQGNSNPYVSNPVP